VKWGDSNFFGRSVVLLLVVLFSLTGMQMLVSQVGLSGVVLGDKSDDHEQQTISPTMTVAPTHMVTVAPTQAPVTASPTNQPTAATAKPFYYAPAAPVEAPAGAVTNPTASPASAVATPVTTPVITATVQAPATTAGISLPTIIITPEPTIAVVVQPSAPGTPVPVSAPVEVRSSSGNVITTTNVVDRSTNETVRQIIGKFGITTAPARAPRIVPKLQSVVKVVEEKTAGEIQRELASLPSQTGAPQVRLRYKFLNGQMVLVGETDTGQETPLASNESASIIGRLARSEALDVKPGGVGEMVFTKGQIRAETELPLLVDLRTNLLTTETSTGIKTVPLLPDEAIKIAFASKVVDGVYQKKSSAEIGFKEAENGRLVYEIDGLSKRKLFGLIPFILKETALVDAGNGRVTQSDKSLGQLLVELVAFPIK